MEFGLPQAVAAGVAVALITLAAAQHRAGRLAGKMAARGRGLVASRSHEAPPAKQDLSAFKPPPTARMLTGRPNPMHVKVLGMVTWEAEDAERIEAFYARVYTEITERLKSLKVDSNEAVESRAQLRQASEARAALLDRLQRAGAVPRQNPQ